MNDDLKEISKRLPQDIDPRFLELLKHQNSGRLNTPPGIVQPIVEFNVQTSPENSDGSAEYDRDFLYVKAVYDPANSVLHFQTDPFWNGERLVVKRLASYQVGIEMVRNIFEEYTVKKSYAEEKS